jgi:hypothetical protein
VRGKNMEKSSTLKAGNMRKVEDREREREGGKKIEKEMENYDWQKCE